MLATGVLILSGCANHASAPVSSRDDRATGTTAQQSRQTAKSAPRQTKPRPRRSSSAYHRVRRGDTLYSIAWNAGLDFRTVATWNGIRSPYLIQPGQLLRLRPPPKPVAANKAAAPVRSRPKTAAAKPRAAPHPKPAAKPASPKNKASPLPSGTPRWRWPTAGKVAEGFVRGDPARKGLKIAGRAGQPVRAAAPGKIVYSGSGLIGYGRLIIVKHNKEFLSAYGHNRKIIVKEGDQVKGGQMIAEMGNPGGASPVLHFEIRRDGKPVDPARFLPRR